MPSRPALAKTLWPPLSKSVHRQLFSALSARLLRMLPQECLLCGLAADRSVALCCHCEDALPRLTAGCRRCGCEMDCEDLDPVCDKCRRRNPVFHRCESLFRYESGAAWLINRFKYHGDLVAGRVLADLLVSHASAGARDDCDLVMAIPLHRIRLGQRGFNQSAYLANKLARGLDLPFAPAGLRRTRWTPTQVSMGSARLRESNVRGIFKVSGNAPELRNKRVLLVDDVVTTQSTLTSASRALQAAGCAAVHCITMARAKLHD